MLFPHPGIYGRKEADENLLLATLLTGEARVPVQARPRCRPRGSHGADPAASSLRPTASANLQRQTERAEILSL